VRYFSRKKYKINFISKINQLIFESNVLFSILDEEDLITKPEEIPHHFVEEINDLINQINLDLIISFQEGKRDF